MSEKISEPPADESKRSVVSGKNRLLVRIIIVLVALLVVASSAAVYYASSGRPSQSDSFQKTMVLDNQSVVGSGGFLYVYAGTFSAPQPHRYVTEII